MDTRGIQLQRVIFAASRMASDFDHGEFVPLLEADVDGYLFHLLLDQGAYRVAEIHQNARILGVEKRRFDLVAGEVQLKPGSQIRPATADPILVVQGKFFPRWGFTDQQHNVHLAHVIHDDIPSLAEVRRRWPDAVRCCLLFDLHLTAKGHGYLSGSLGGRQRIDVIEEKCRAAGASLVWVHPESHERTAVEVLGSAKI